MADDEDLEELEGDLNGDGEEGASRGKKGGRKKLLILVAAALLLVVGGVAAAYFTGLLDDLASMITGSETAGEGESTPTSAGPASFYDVPEILVNLNVGGRRNTFIKIRVALELARPDDKVRIEMLMPRIINDFNTYLRELRVEDLKGSAGMYRLREELLIRVNAAVAPAEVRDVLFKEMLVQ